MPPTSTRRRTASRRWLVGAAIIAGSLAAAGGSDGVQACSLAPAPSLDDLRPGESAGGFDPSTVTGVYEYETIARSTGWFADRSVTIVTRYWGDAPDDVGRRVVTPGCGREVSESGTVGYWWVSASERRFRSSLTLADTSGGLTAEQETTLVERFGPPTDLDITLVDRILASGRVWRWELIAIAVVGGLGALVVVRIRRTADRVAPETISR